MDFASFKQNEATRNAFRSMNIEDLLEASDSWETLRRCMVLLNGSEEGHFVQSARRYERTCSAGESVLLRVILYVADFAWLADKLDRGHTWDRVRAASREHRQAVAACLVATL